MLTISIMEDHRRFLSLFPSVGRFSDEAVAAVEILKRGIDGCEWDVGLHESEVPDEDASAPDIDEETVLEGPVGRLDLPDDNEIKTRLDRLVSAYKDYPRWKAEAAIFAIGLSGFYAELRYSPRAHDDQKFAEIVDEMPHEMDEEPDWNPWE